MTPFERAIWEKANRERREAQDKADRELRAAIDKLRRERAEARDKFQREYRRQMDKLKQEMRDAANDKRRGEIQAAIDDLKRKAESAAGEDSAGEVAIDLARAKVKILADKWRGHERGLVFCDRVGMAKRAAEMMAAFDLGLLESVGLIVPEMPPFLGEGGMWKTPGFYTLNSSLERWEGPSSSGEEAVEGTYYQATSDGEFDALWGGWLGTIGPIDNILWNAGELASFLRDLVGGSGLDRDTWRPGRLNREAFVEALSTVHPEASVAWNAAFEGIPTPPGSITLTTFSESGFTYPDSQGDYFLMSKRRPENHDAQGGGFETAQALWDTWLDDLQNSHGAMQQARELLAASRPALERALEAFRPFGLGTQYRFRGK